MLISYCMKKITNGEKEYVIDKVIIEGGRGVNE
jgi:hypothetical protein